jgi:translocation protein SEC63
MHLICDSYVGFDTKMEVTLVVDEAAKAAEIEAEDDISEPDEGRSQPNTSHLRMLTAQ